MKKHIISIHGLPGAGKTEATNYLLKKTSWPKIYFGEITFDVMKEKGLEVSEANERKTREGLRAEHGMEVYAKLSLPKIKKLYESSDVVLESMYSWEEYLVIKDEFKDAFVTIAIYASPKTRGARMKNRSVRPLNAEEFESRDYSQIENIHQAGPIARANYTIINEGTMEEMTKRLDDILEEIKKS
ncbi:MAG: dephospho-CoA kinase [Candidatus Doudnabacteria bacterium CG10_big_fil_rev_8_21_14_0_10_41_10]|uniref:Dephospho-CoA kinase n=1 Tax=Candidatus Doudnabacteria bacterium CG10_big_fil_rev_8_21_14_0_10_41_10 TaxID=1974551 RepID=A0A2H0VC93_9BACT|nr:MAG: dephospho-CoA kinase [Candidatus Doudnabacteria bacterium CG10_big_fil_rev_8_21_14_0_10_41_10]